MNKNTGIYYTKGYKDLKTKSEYYQSYDKIINKKTSNYILNSKQLL